MMGAFSVSSLVDNIILMNWVELGDTFRLGLTIAKMRSNPTTRTTTSARLSTEGHARAATGAPGTPWSLSAYRGLISRSPERVPAPPNGAESRRSRQVAWRTPAKRCSDRNEGEPRSRNFAP